VPEAAPAPAPAPEPVAVQDGEEEEPAPSPEVMREAARRILRLAGRPDGRAWVEGYVFNLTQDRNRVTTVHIPGKNRAKALRDFTAKALEYEGGGE